MTTQTPTVISIGTAMDMIETLIDRGMVETLVDRDGQARRLSATCQLHTPSSLEVVFWDEDAGGAEDSVEVGTFHVAFKPA